MPRRCTICNHPHRSEIERSLVAEQLSYKQIAACFGTSPSTLSRHKRLCIAPEIARAEQAAKSVVATVEQKRVSEAEHRFDLRSGFLEAMAKLNRMLQAADEWLQDPERPGFYNIGPRAEEVVVVYSELDANGKPQRHCSTLSALLDRITNATGIEIESTEDRTADPRRLLLETIGKHQRMLDLAARVGEQLQDRSERSFQQEWREIRRTLMGALRPFPKAREAVAAALMKLSNKSDGCD